jgi:ribosome-binding factor A
MTQHHDQLQSALERGVREVLARGVNDPRVCGLITVTSVKLSQDLRHATIGVSVLPEEKAALTVQGLGSAARHIRREVGERVRTRVMPELTFKHDASLRKEARVLGAIEEARRSDAGDEKAADGSPDRTPGHGGWSKKAQEP